MQNKKHIQSQFICKITDMMDKHSNLISWNDNGTELYLNDIDKICQQVLPEYFRHTNFNSFIRQLNMYSFHKTKKVGRSIWFKNEIFRKGNQNNFFLIQRKRKFKELQNYQQRFERQCQQIISQVNSKKQLTPEIKQTLISLLQYKYVSYENLRRMKCQIEGINKQLKDSRNKKVQEICGELKSDVTMAITQLNSQARKIDQYIMKNFLKQHQETKESLEPIANQKIYNRNYDNVFNLPQNYMKSRSIIKEDSIEKPSNSEVKQNLKSFNSIPIFLEQFKTKKQHMTYEQKLYNPFNSQNSFVFLPNYIGGPSQFPMDGKYNTVFQSKIQQNPQQNMNFQNYQQSASISFARDLSDRQDEDFSEH